MNPFRRDLLLAIAGKTVDKVGPRKRYGWAVGVMTGGKPLSRSRTSRHAAGDPHSPFAKVLLALAQNGGLTPWPLVAEGVATVLQAEIESAPVETLEAGLAELKRRAHEEHATSLNAAPGMNAAHARAQEVATLLEIVAIERELALRSGKWRDE